MQETTYFVPEPKKVIVTKKHFALMLFAWWFLIQFFNYVINPSAKILYQNMFEEGIMNVYPHGRNPNRNQTATRSQQSSEKSQSHSNKKAQLAQNSEIQESIEDVRGMSKNEDIRIHFKIKGKGKSSQELRQKAAQMSIKMAMEDYLVKRKQH